MRNGRKRTRAEWTKLVEESQASDLTQKAFAQRRGLSPTTLSWWASRLRREAQEQASLVAVDIVEGSGEDTATRTVDFRVELASGRTVLVPAAFDAAALRRLVTALESSAC
ncbi:MAG TPA: hypothetical protein VKQ06_05010 [Gammaproteobacteria bacterium]|nr:hypothetical protein [Gammaproteobacteria bacterium]